MLHLPQIAHQQNKYGHEPPPPPPRPLATMPGSSPRSSRRPLDPPEEPLPSFNDWIVRSIRHTERDHQSTEGLRIMYHQPKDLKTPPTAPAAHKTAFQTLAEAEEQQRGLLCHRELSCFEATARVIRFEMQTTLAPLLLRLLANRAEPRGRGAVLEAECAARQASLTAFHDGLRFCNIVCPSGVTALFEHGRLDADLISGTTALASQGSQPLAFVPSPPRNHAPPSSLQQHVATSTHPHPPRREAGGNTYIRTAAICSHSGDTSGDPAQSSPIRFTHDIPHKGSGNNPHPPHWQQIHPPLFETAMSILLQPIASAETSARRRIVRECEEMFEEDILKGFQKELQTVVGPRTVKRRHQERCEGYRHDHRAQFEHIGNVVITEDVLLAECEAREAIARRFYFGLSLAAVTAEGDDNNNNEPNDVGGTSGQEAAEALAVGTDHQEKERDTRCALSTPSLRSPPSPICSNIFDVERKVLWWQHFLPCQQRIARDDITTAEACDRFGPKLEAAEAAEREALQLQLVQSEEAAWRQFWSQHIQQYLYGKQEDNDHTSNPPSSSSLRYDTVESCGVFRHYQHHVLGPAQQRAVLRERAVRIIQRGFRAVRLGLKGWRRTHRGIGGWCRCYRQKRNRERERIAHLLDITV